MFKDELISSRPPWQPNSQKPKDLKRSDKMLYSFNLNLNQSSNNLLRETNSFVEPHFKTLKESKSISKVYSRFN